MGKSIRLITFHASHNFGSVMQAYALKQAVEGLGHECRIVNFRPKAQVDKYSVIPRQHGGKMLMRSLANYALNPLGWRRTYQAYEEFIANRLTVDSPVHEMKDLRQLECDVMLTGSDQVWGYQIPEFVNSSEDIRPAYYFSFSEGKKVAYAASTGTATSEQLAPFAPLLREYSHIAVREKESVGIISKLSGRDVRCVLDPTFLLSGADYRESLDIRPRPKGVSKGYCLIYSLQGLSARGNWLKLAETVKSVLGIPIVSVSHFIPLRGAGIHSVTNIGPIDTLSLFANADYVLTDTYHGTLFATHFEKQFIVFIPGRRDPRIEDITSRLGLTDRVAKSVDDAATLLRGEVDSNSLAQIRQSEVSRSMEYLVTALGE